MKAIILAGGTGSRLYPLTQNFSKHFQAVYDKPMAYYPLTILMAAGVREFCLISTPQDLPNFIDLFKDGKQWGISIEYKDQPKPEGIAQAFLIAEDFIGQDNVILALGDNIFSGSNEVAQAIKSFQSGATVFAYRVNNPSDYGVIEFDKNGKALSLEEKPKNPKSHYAVPGIYVYDNHVVTIAKDLKPSQRGELEITDVNREYMIKNQLSVHRLGRGFAWLDAGTSSSLQEASDYVKTIEQRQGLKIGCPEEAALQRGFITPARFEILLDDMPNCEYREYLAKVFQELKSEGLYK